MNRLRAARPTTCIYIQIKRNKDTYFILCDEYDPVESLKSRILNVLEQSGFVLERMEEPMTTDDFRLCLKKRVSIYVFFMLLAVSTFHFHFAHLYHLLQVLDNTATCHDQQVFNNCVLYLCFKKVGTAEFETLAEVAPGVNFEYDFSGNVRKREENKAEAD